MTHEKDYTDEVIIDSMRFRTRGGPISDSNLAVFQNKITLGDFSLDSHPTFSTYIMSDFSGGLGIEEMNEGSDINRYRLGTLYTRRPKQISKAYKVTTFMVDITGAYNARYFGNLKISGSWDIVHSLASALEIEAMNFGPLGILSTEPVNRTVLFKGTSANTRLVFPLGSAGYAVVSSTGAFAETAPSATKPALMAATVWDNKIIGVDTSGIFWYAVDASGAWTQYNTTTARLPTGSDVKSLVTYFDRQGTRAVFAVTESDVWQFDPDDESIFSVDVKFPPHPYHGLAAEAWASDMMFSVGVGIHRYSGGTLSAMGLDRDDGLPIEYAGYIVGGGLVAGYNALYAFITKPNLSGYTFAGSAPTATSGVYEWTGGGWHMIWESTTQDIVPYSMGISRLNGVGDSYSLLWGAKDTTNGDSYIHLIDLPTSFFNPKQRARVNNIFAPNGWLETGVFDAQMPGYSKTANAVDVDIDTMAAGATLTVKYRKDGATAWTTLGTVTTTGVTSLPFGTLTEGIYPGMSFKHIQFRFDLSDASDDGFIMESAVFSFIKRRPSQQAWTLQLDLTKQGPGGHRPKTMRDKINTIIDNGLFVPMVLHGTTYRVLITSDSGADEAGLNEASFRNVSVLEIPQTVGT